MLGQRNNAVDNIRMAATQLMPVLKADQAPAPIDKELDEMFGKQVESDCEDCPAQKPEAPNSAAEKSKQKRKTKKKKVMNPEEKAPAPAKEVNWVSEMMTAHMPAAEPKPKAEPPQIVSNHVDNQKKNTVEKRKAILRKWYRVS